MALSVKTREHIRRWAALAGPKWGALLGGAAALAAAIAFTGAALHFTTVADTHGDTVRILTAATDLAAVLQQSGTPPLGEHDEAVWSQTEDGERLDVLRAYTVPVTADGAMQELTVTGTHTTAELLESAGLTYTADDLLTPAADEIVPEGSGITVQRVTYNEYTVDEVVPTEIEEIPTSLFYRKQSKVMTLEEGHDGQDTVVYREKWIDGEWAETNEIERVNEAEMVPTVQKIYGEQAPVSGFVGPDVVDGVPVEGVAATYTGSVPRAIPPPPRQGCQRAPTDLRHSGHQSGRHTLRISAVHHQRRWKVRLWLRLRRRHRHGSGAGEGFH